MKIFVSYHHLDRALVDALEDDLRSLGHDVWFDRELTGGQIWWNEICEAIRDRDVFVIALTPRWLESVPSRLEFEYAAACNRVVVPVMLAPVDVTTLPAELAALQFVKYTDRTRNDALRLGRVFTKLSPMPLPDPIPNPPPAPISPLNRLRNRIDAPTLSREEQASLVYYELKALLDAPDTQAQARAFIERLLARRSELYADIAANLQSMLAQPVLKPRRRTGLLAGISVLILALVVGGLVLSLLNRGTNTGSSGTPSPTALALVETATQARVTPPAKTSLPNLPSATAINTPMPPTRMPTAIATATTAAALATNSPVMSVSLAPVQISIIADSNSFTIVVSSEDRAKVSLETLAFRYFGGLKLFKDMFGSIVDSSNAPANACYRLLVDLKNDVLPGQCMEKAVYKRQINPNTADIYWRDEHGDFRAIDILLDNISLWAYPCQVGPLRPACAAVLVTPTPVIGTSSVKSSASSSPIKIGIAADSDGFTIVVSSDDPATQKVPLDSLAFRYPGGLKLFKDMFGSIVDSSSAPANACYRLLVNDEKAVSPMQCSRKAEYKRVVNPNSADAFWKDGGDNFRAIDILLYDYGLLPYPCQVGPTQPTCQAILVTPTPTNSPTMPTATNTPISTVS